MGQDYRAIYRTEADRYDALVAREDWEGNLPRALGQISPHFESAVELGAGTGRVTAILAPLCRSIHAFDGSPHMIEKARDKLARFAHVTLGVADNASIPRPDRSADLVMAGWTIGHLVGWHPEDWSVRVDAVIAEMRRLAREGATIAVIETLGTGQTEARAPRADLGAYYARLETVHGFERTEIRTDYRFADLDEALALAGFFFGDAMAERVRAEHWVVLPEYTGVWKRRTGDC
jgi:ubiquinone/menaquinone biosynthesis C-methylase UbiE